ncbi:phosphopantetheine-binding protein [Nonomuraea sp. NPDC050786]|uniref:phosphopantetheine-binding protein n=1 Tax=Nonomuraea sp. NPDC050786 TaxID=3154840 RepID=UPI003410216B
MESWDGSFEMVLRPHLVLLDEAAPVVSDLDLREAGVDSLALVELLVSIEETYEVEFPDELLIGDTFRTPATLWAAIADLLERAGRQPARG